MRKFKKGMVFALCIIPGERADTPWIEVIDTSKLLDEGEDALWLKAIKEEFEDSDKEGQKTYPWDWDVLKKARINTFPVSIDGALDLFFEVDE